MVLQDRPMPSHLGALCHHVAWEKTGDPQVGEGQLSGGPWAPVHNRTDTWLHISKAGTFTGKLGRRPNLHHCHCTSTCWKSFRILGNGRLLPGPGWPLSLTNWIPEGEVCVTHSQLVLNIWVYEDPGLWSSLIHVCIRTQDSISLTMLVCKIVVPCGSHLGSWREILTPRSIPGPSVTACDVDWALRTTEHPRFTQDTVKTDRQRSEVYIVKVPKSWGKMKCINSLRKEVYWARPVAVAIATPAGFKSWQWSPFPDHHLPVMGIRFSCLLPEV